MSWHTKLELNFSSGVTPNLDNVSDEVLNILRRDGIHDDAFGDLRDAFRDGVGHLNCVGAYVAELIVSVAKLFPETSIEARISGEEFRDTSVLQLQGENVSFRVGTWPYDS